MVYNGQTGDYPPVVENLKLSGFRVANAPIAISLRGLPAHPIDGVTITDCRFSDIDFATLVIDHARNVSFNGQPVA